jgi:hypothetical protein
MPEMGNVFVVRHAAISDFKHIRIYGNASACIATKYNRNER